MTFVEELEKAFGDPLMDRSAWSFAKALEFDEGDRFPQPAFDLLKRVGFQRQLVPVALGGEARSAETLLQLVRALSRRDVTVAVGKFQTMLAATPVWISGSPEIQKRVAELILLGEDMGIALTEREHGADLVASDFVFEGQGTLKLNGEKWLINNATRGGALSLLAREKGQSGSRSLSLLFVDKAKLEYEGFTPTKKNLTHGIRGADISGIRFDDCAMADANVIGRRGFGLDVTLKTLQFSRTLCAGLSLGGADSALRLSAAFARDRVLYGKPIVAMGVVRKHLVDAFVDLQIAEAVAAVGVRALHLAPEQMSVYSAVNKYFVPTLVQDLVRRLATVIGARGYLREPSPNGAFQKLSRDLDVVPLFDGSSQINLNVIATQLPALARSRGETADGKDLFDRKKPLPDWNFARIRYSNSGSDLVLNSFLPAVDACKEPMLKQLAEKIKARIIENDVRALALAQLGQETTSLPELYELAHEYCLLHAASCCFQLALPPEIKQLCLQAILIKLGLARAEMSAAEDTVFADLMNRLEKNLSFGIDATAFNP